MSDKEPNIIAMTSASLDDAQKLTVLTQLWISLRQTFVKMHELNGPQAVIDMQKTLISGAKNSHFTGIPLEKEKAITDTVVTLLEGLITVKRDG